MAKGMIQDKMGRPEGEDITLENVTKNIKIPPELQEAYERVVLAGMKVMFSDKTHRMMLQEIQKGGPVPERLGKSVAGLMLMLFKESNESMPPQVIIPAGMELMMQAVDFVRRSGLEKISNKDIGDAIEIMLILILEKFGVTPEQIQQMLVQFDNSNVNAAAQQMGGQA